MDHKLQLSENVYTAMHMIIAELKEAMNMSESKRLEKYGTEGLNLLFSTLKDFCTE